MSGCDEVLKHGIFNQIQINSDARLKETFYQWLYDMDFQTHDEAISSGLSVGFVVYGVPLQLGGKFDKQQKDQWRREHAQYENRNVSASEKYSILTSTVSATLMNAWLSCEGWELANRVFGAVAVDRGGDTAEVQVFWNPIEGDLGANPVVNSSEIAHGKRNSDGMPVVFDRGHELRKGISAALITREHGQPLSIVIQTTRGDVTGYLPAAVDVPEITEFSASPASVLQGADVTLRWVTKNATQVAIDHDVGPVGVSGTFIVRPRGTVTYTLTASSPEGSVNGQATVQVEPIRLTQLDVVFDTGDDGKDWDTEVSVTITKGGRQLAEWHRKSWEHEEWKEHQRWPKGMTLNGVVTMEDIPGASLDVTIQTVGNDTFKFNISLEGKKSSGQAYSWNGGFYVLNENKTKLDTLTVG
jgi:hypothetical protein